MSRPTVAEIDLNAIAHNLGEIRRLVGLDVKICPAVKADGYGHGAVEVSRTVLDAGADMLCVATVEEGIELRRAGISAPILLLGCSLPDDIRDIMRFGLACTVSDVAFAQRLGQAAWRVKRRAKVHIKVDTGMGRIGVQADQAVASALSIATIPGLEIEGIFTHFPCADEDDLCFTHGQVAEFGGIIARIESAGLHIPLRHAANSGAILNVPASYLTMVRPGIMLYGLYDAPLPAGVELRPAMALKTRIAFLKELPPGRTVSYGRTFSTTKPTLVATIPIGYGDGYSRSLSSRGPALVHGRRVPVVGRVCMDQTMLDVTSVPGASVGDEVVLYGRQDHEEIRVEEVASLLGTISYEVVCSVGKRVRRAYSRVTPPTDGDTSTRTG